MKTRLVKVILPATLYRALAKRANNDGENLSTVIRLALRRYLGEG